MQNGPSREEIAKLCFEPNTVKQGWWREAIVTQLCDFLIDDLANLVAQHVPASVAYSHTYRFYIVEYHRAQPVFGLIEGKCTGKRIGSANPSIDVAHLNALHCE